MRKPTVQHSWKMMKAPQHHRDLPVALAIESPVGNLGTLPMLRDWVFSRCYGFKPNRQPTSRKSTEGLPNYESHGMLSVQVGQKMSEIKQGSAKYNSTNLHTGWHWMAVDLSRHLNPPVLNSVADQPMEVKSSILAMNSLIDFLILLLWLVHLREATTSTVQSTSGFYNLKKKTYDRGLPICASLPTARTHQVSPECAWMQMHHGDQTNNLITASQNDRFWERTNPTWHILCR